METVTGARRIPRAASAPRRLSLTLSEDWLAVVVAFLSIGLVLAGLRPALPAFDWAHADDLAATVLSGRNLQRLLAVGAAAGALSVAAVFLMEGSVKRIALGFPAVFALASLAQVIAGNRVVSGWGIEYVVVAFALGLFVSNVVGLPDWLRDGVRTEFYIKTGLVILGTSIVFGDLMQAGLLGIGQAVLVVTAVWFVCFRLARRLRVDEEFATMLATAVSICGVSAAIAACGAIQGDRRKLSYTTSLVILVAAPMMVVMPQVVTGLGIPDIVGGAWLGGTLDTSASVVAAGEMVSARARDAGVVVKLSQNVLIGVAAFFLTIWWTLRAGHGPAGRPSVWVIWERFPKFVLGFLAASFIVSFLLAPSRVSETKGLLTGLRTVWFALAFTSIGLETRFSELLKTGSGRPALAFLGGQAFNVVWTLVIAYLLFSGAIFEPPRFQ